MAPTLEQAIEVASRKAFVILDGTLLRIDGAWLLDRLWHRLGIDALLRRLAGGTRRDPVVERVLFALVANRALAPSSKLAATSWVAYDVHVPGLDGGDYRVSDDACYRAMDWLIAVEDRLAGGVFDAVADLLNLEVDLIFFDTTSTYFETEDADPPVWRDEHGRVVEPDVEPDVEDAARPRVADSALADRNTEWSTAIELPEFFPTLLGSPAVSWTHAAGRPMLR
jgi:hypothetical protein